MIFTTKVSTLSGPDESSSFQLLAETDKKTKTLLLFTISPSTPVPDMEPKSPTQPSGSGFEPQASREKAYNDLYPERRGEGHGEYTTWEKMTGKNLESVDR